MSGKWIDLMPLLEKWKVDVRLMEIELDTIPRWRFLKRQSLRDKANLMRTAIGAVYADSEVRTFSTVTVTDLVHALERAAFVAEHLHQMIPRETWREYGAEWMGEYEGDQHAVDTQDEIEGWRALLRTVRGET